MKAFLGYYTFLQNNNLMLWILHIIFSYSMLRNICVIQVLGGWRCNYMGKIQGHCFTSNYSWGGWGLVSFITMILLIKISFLSWLGIKNFHFNYFFRILFLSSNYSCILGCCTWFFFKTVAGDRKGKSSMEKVQINACWSQS